MIPHLFNERVRFHLRRWISRLWFWPTAYSVAAVAVLGVAVALPDTVKLPDYLTFAADSMEPVLTVLASSMLAVVTFSLSAIVAALAAAAQSATPRASTLLMEDSAVQRPLSVFVGAFLFAIVAIVGGVGNVYSDAGRLLVFGATITLIAIVVATLLQWIDRITRLGRVGEIVDRAERATQDAFLALARAPGLGARVRTGPPPPGYPVHTSGIGYVQHIDVPLLSDRLPKGATAHLVVRPGAFVDPARPVAVLDSPPDDALVEAVCAAITIGDGRSFEQDPRFGMVVLAEIASKALSPAVNDVGTAIDVIGTMTRLVWHWRAARAEAQQQVENVTIAPISCDDLLEDAFRPIARDGASQVEVGLRLVAALRSIAAIDDAELAAAAAARLDDVLARAGAALAPQDLAVLRAAASGTR